MMRRRGLMRGRRIIGKGGRKAGIVYRSVDECLRDVFRFGQLRIGPMGNAQQMIEWGESDGILRGKGALTQAEWHANAVMIQSRIARVLSRFEFAAVACYYGGADLHYIVDLGVFIEQQNRGGICCCVMRFWNICLRGGQRWCRFVIGLM